MSLDLEALMRSSIWLNLEERTSIVVQSCRLDLEDLLLPLPNLA